MIELGSKVSAKAFQEAGKSLEKGGGKSSGTSSNPFSSIMDQVQGKDTSEVVKAISGELDLRPTQDFTAMPSEQMPDMAVKSADFETQSNTMNKIAGIMGEVNDGQVKLQRLVDLVTSGQKISPQEMIAIEAGVFSLTQELELVGKVTQEATQGVRQTLNTNLG